jgi:hypothetical protein
MRRVYEYLQGPYISQSLTEVAKKNNFFTKIDKTLNQRQYVRVTLLDWDENPLKELQGVLSSGTLTKDGTSSVRRTLSLQAQIDSGGYNISNLSDEFSINKKVFIELGVKNETGEYPQYPILWFPQGVFFIYQVSISSSATSSVSLSMSLRDKMGMLNGDIGGKIAATTILDEEDVWDETTQSYVSKKVLVYDIIENAVNHLGGEPLQNIVIEDVDTRIQRVMKWTGTNPLYLCSTQTDEQEKDTSCQYQAVTERPADGVPNTSYSNGQDCGYVYDDFTYTGDLTVNTGATVTDILDSIVSYLGNYEYFYDEFGVFHFREIKNYLNTTYQSVSGENIKSDITYSSEYTMGEASFALDRNSNLISISSQPSYANIKNEYVVEGLRQSTVDSISYPVRYHLVIDEKPVPCERRNFAFYEDEDTGNIIAAVVRDVNGDYPEETEYENIDYDEQKPIDPKDGYIYRFDNFPVQKQGSEKTKDEVVQDPETAKGKELYQVQEPYTWENSTLDEIKTAMNAIIQSSEFIEAVDEKYQSQKDSAADKIDTANVVFKDSFDLYLPGSKGTSYEKYYIPRVFKDTEARGTREITNEDGTTTKKELMYPYTTASTSDCSVWLQNPLQFFLSQESMGYEVIEKEGSYEIEFYQLKGNEKVELTDYKPAVFKLIDKISEGETKNITRVGSEKLTSLSDYVGNVFCGVEGLSYTSFDDLKDAVSAITPVFEKTPALSLTNKDTIISNADKAKNILSKAVSSASVDSIGKSGASEAIERKASYASFCGCENTMTQDISNLENKVKELLLDGKVSNSETALSYSLSYTYSLKPVTEKMLNILASYNGSTGEYDVLENAEFRASFTPKDWRSHLYFDGIVSEVNGLDENPYFEELYAYWPTIYNILPRDKSKKDSEDVESFKDIEGNYFLDFIDASTTAIGEYNVNAIGRRADIVSDTNINCLFDLEVPEVCFIDSTSDNRQEEIQECVNNQEPWTIVPNEIYDSLATGGYRNSAYDQIKYELYLHTNYQRTLSITAIPAFYLEPNTRVEISDATTNTYGDFLIKSITYTLGQSPNMTISAAEVFERSAF